MILWNALSFVGGGRYVDIGAWDPDPDSVSRAFFERGWQGMHVEMLGDMAVRLRQARPDDRVIEAAVDSVIGSTTMYCVEGTGLSTLDDGAAIDAMKRGYSVSARPVDTVRIADLLDDFGGPVHWLKIDVEGAEDRVLSTLSLTDVRPWIIVVEATFPNSTSSTFGIREINLLSCGYEHALDDGLNRYYVFSDGPIRSSSVRHPNVVDDFTISPDSSSFGRAARQAVAEIAAQRDELWVERDGLVAERNELWVERDGLVAERDWWFAQFHRLRERRSVRLALRLAGMLGRLTAQDHRIRRGTNA